MDMTQAYKETNRIARTLEAEFYVDPRSRFVLKHFQTFLEPSWVIKDGFGNMPVVLSASISRTGDYAGNIILGIGILKIDI
jgi:hypothetical protein